MGYFEEKPLKVMLIEKAIQTLLKGDRGIVWYLN